MRTSIRPRRRYLALALPVAGAVTGMAVALAPASQAQIVSAQVATSTAAPNGEIDQAPPLGATCNQDYAEEVCWRLDDDAETVSFWVQSDNHVTFIARQTHGGELVREYRFEPAEAKQITLDGGDQLELPASAAPWNWGHLIVAGGPSECRAEIATEHVPVWVDKYYVKASCSHIAAGIKVRGVANFDAQDDEHTAWITELNKVYESPRKVPSNISVRPTAHLEFQPAS